MHMAVAALLGLLQILLLRSCQADAGLHSVAGVHQTQQHSFESSENLKKDVAAAWSQPARQLLQASDAPAADWACPAGGNITDAARTAIMNGQPCVAAVGFPGRLRCGTVLANPKLVLDINFKLCKRITPVGSIRHARASAVLAIASLGLMLLSKNSRLSLLWSRLLRHVHLPMCGLHRKPATPPLLRPMSAAHPHQAPPPKAHRRSSSSSSKWLRRQNPCFSSHLTRLLPRWRLSDRRRSPTAAPIARRRHSEVRSKQPHQLQDKPRQMPTWSWLRHLQVQSRLQNRHRVRPQTPVPLAVC